jgi:hypothetical protein
MWVHLFDTLFNWPNGIVVGNLIASAMCFVVAIVHLDRLAKKHHALLKAHINAQHEALKRHITAEHEKSRALTRESVS